MAETTLERPKEAKAVVRYLRMAPRKVRLVTRAIARKPIASAFTTLTALNKKAARLVEKGLKSAVFNAKGRGLDESRLVISEIKVDGGPTMKRFMSRSMGRADQILKRSSHLTIVLREGKKVFGSPFFPPTSGEAKAEKKEKPKKEKAQAAA